MTQTVDAVIIGAGHNGLVAANLLADAGWDVVVLEAADGPGGAVRSAELTVPGFVHDVCSAFYPLAPVSPLAALDLEGYGLRWTHAPVVLAHPLPDGRAAVLDRDLDATAASIGQFAAGDADAWRRTVEAWRRISGPLVDALMSPFPPVRAGMSVLRRTGPADALRLVRQFLLPVRRYADELFDGDGAKLLLTGLAMHTDLSPHDAGSAAYGWLLAMLGQDYGFPVPVGGAGRITDALVDRLRSRDVDVQCETPVDRVLIAGGRAVGVRTAHGDLWRARRAVLADVPAPTLYRDLVGLDRLPARLADDLTAFQWDNGTIKVDWALSGPVPWKNPEVGRAGTLHLGGDLEALSRYAADLTAGHVPTTPFLLAGQMTTTDAARSPAGTETMWAYTHVPRRDHWPMTAVVAQADRMEQVVESYAPGFRDLIAARHVLGPDEFERHNPSLVGGAVNGGTSAPYQQLVFRPVPGLGRADTPIDRLYLAGSSAHPGGGVHGASGSNAARAALARWRPLLGTAYRTTIGVAHRSIYRTRS